MKAEVIKSNYLEHQVILIAPKEDIEPWWNEIAICILTRIGYCRKRKLKHTEKKLWEIYNEIEKQIKGVE